jgi:hypothetical protein
MQPRLHSKAVNMGPDAARLGCLRLDRPPGRDKKNLARGLAGGPAVETGAIAQSPRPGSCELFPARQALVGVPRRGTIGPVLAPPLGLTAAAARSDALAAAVALAAVVARSSSLTAVARSGHGGLTGRDATLSVASLRLVAQFARTIVARIRRHRPPVRALRCKLCLQRGSVAAGRFTLFALGYGEICKTSHGSE